MSRIILVLLLGLSLLASFSVQAGNRNWHEHKHKKGQKYKHAGGHYVLHRARYRGCKHRSHKHKHYRGQAQFFTIPQVAAGTRYGYSAGGTVIVYEIYSLNGRR